MVRSFDYAASFSVARQGATGVDPRREPMLELWARFWTTWATAVFLTSYLDTMKTASLLPAGQKETAALLNALLLARALSEIATELESHPDRLSVPIRAILRMLEG